MWWWAAAALAAPTIDGTWALADDKAALAATHEQAIEAGAQNVAWLFRAVAKPMLRGSVNNCDRLKLGLQGGQFLLQCDDKPPVEHTVGAGTSSYVGKDGDTYTVDLTVGDDWVELTFTGERGGQRSRFTVESDGRILQRKELFSSHLTEPIVWEARYRRTGD